MTPTLEGLLKRVEEASGPDRWLDREITRLVAPDMAGDDPWSDKAYPKLTASIDAAVALVERVLPGKDLDIHTGTRIYTTLWLNRAGHFRNGKGTTPALSILSALLRALQEKTKRPSSSLTASNDEG